MRKIIYLIKMNYSRKKLKPCVFKSIYEMKFLIAHEEPCLPRSELH